VGGSIAELDKRYLSMIQEALKQYQPELELSEIVDLPMPRMNYVSPACETITGHAPGRFIATARLIWGQEEERRRLARELHDDLTQRLAVLAIQTGKMEQAAISGCQPDAQTFRALRDQAVQISADVHNISRQIHPSILDDLGLEKAIEAQCTRFSNREGLAVDFRAEGIAQTLSKDVALSIYRIIQEGFTNIAKYACARNVALSLKGTGEELYLCVRDDGIGFDAAEVRKKPGLGLSSMRERVRIIHGTLRIASEPEKGTTIEVTVPLKAGQNMVQGEQEESTA